jgi:hypothetical protein
MSLSCICYFYGSNLFSMGSCDYHKSKTVGTSKTVLIGVILIIICDIIIHSSMLTSLFGMLLPGVALVVQILHTYFIYIFIILYGQLCK